MHALNIVKADCRRILKDKPIRIILIIAVCLTVFLYLIFWVLKLFALELAVGMVELAAAIEMAEMSIDLMFSMIVFYLVMGLGNVGTFACLASSIFSGGDFTFNTIRNKLISGNSRVKTYLSTCITSAIVTCGFYAFMCILSMILNFLMFGYNGGTLFAAAFTFLPLYLWLGIFVTFFAMLTRSRSLTIVLTIIVISILPGLLSSIATLSNPDSTISVVFNQIIRFFPLNIFAEVVPGGLSNDIVLRATLVPLVYMAVMIPLGAWAFTKADIK